MAQENVFNREAAPVCQGAGSDPVDLWWSQSKRRWYGNCPACQRGLNVTQYRNGRLVAGAVPRHKPAMTEQQRHLKPRYWNDPRYQD